VIISVSVIRAEDGKSDGADVGLVAEEVRGLRETVDVRFFSLVACCTKCLETGLRARTDIEMTRRLTCMDNSWMYNATGMKQDEDA
jgi:hypothetical protein